MGRPLVLFLALFTLIGCRGGNKAEDDNGTIKPSETCEATTLYNFYKINQKAGDERYKDKVIVVTGEIQTFGKTGDNPYIELRSGNESSPIRCVFSDTHSS